MDTEQKRLSLLSSSGKTLVSHPKEIARIQLSLKTEGVCTRASAFSIISTFFIARKNYTTSGALHNARKREFSCNALRIAVKTKCSQLSRLMKL